MQSMAVICPTQYSRQPPHSQATDSFDAGTLLMFAPTILTHVTNSVCVTDKLADSLAADDAQLHHKRCANLMCSKLLVAQLVLLPWRG